MPTADRYVTVCARSRSIGSAFRRASQSRDAGQIYRLLRIEHVSVRPAARSVDGVRSSGAARSSQMAATRHRWPRLPDAVELSCRCDGFLGYTCYRLLWLPRCPLRSLHGSPVDLTLVPHR